MYTYYYNKPYITSSLTLRTYTVILYHMTRHFREYFFKKFFISRLPFHVYNHMCIQFVRNIHFYQYATVHTIYVYV